MDLTDFCELFVCSGRRIIKLQTMWPLKVYCAQCLTYKSILLFFFQSWRCQRWLIWWDFGDKWKRNRMSRRSSTDYTRGTQKGTHTETPFRSLCCPKWTFALFYQLKKLLRKQSTSNSSYLGRVYCNPRWNRLSTYHDIHQSFCYPSELWCELDLWTKSKGIRTW